MLNEGTWNGELLLPEEFVRAARSSNAVNGGYGFLLWTNQGDHFWTPTVPGRRLIERPIVPSAPRDMYAMMGAEGQNIYIVPSLDMVIERSGDPPNRDPEPQTLAVAIPTGDFEWDLFRRLDTAMTYAHWHDPGPYQPVDPTPVSPYGVVDPQQALAAAGVGPQAGGCNLVGCDGKVDVSGYERQRDEAARYFQGLVRRGAVRP
jgi:hypothetical protein